MCENVNSLSSDTSVRRAGASIFNSKNTIENLMINAGYSLENYDTIVAICKGGNYGLDLYFIPPNVSYTYAYGTRVNGTYYHIVLQGIAGVPKITRTEGVSGTYSIGTANNVEGQNMFFIGIFTKNATSGTKNESDVVVVKVKVLPTKK